MNLCRSFIKCSALTKGIRILKINFIDNQKKQNPTVVKLAFCFGSVIVIYLLELTLSISKYRPNTRNKKSQTKKECSSEGRPINT